MFSSHRRLVAQGFGILKLVLTIGITLFFFTLPGLRVVQDLQDPAYSSPGIAKSAWRIHKNISPRLETWAKDRVASRRAESAALHDVATTEWPMFSSVFYLMATEQLQAAWDKGNHDGGQDPREYDRGAVAAARDLIIDPSHHTWVRTHWGDNYLHRENFFFRSLIIAGLTSYQGITRDGSSVAMLRDQVETLAAELDNSQLGLLQDYPGECYPIDVLAGIAWIRRADLVLGTDHSAFVKRSLRGFEGKLTDAHGLVPFRLDIRTGLQEQPSRGVGNSWISIFAPDLWPEQSKEWYARYEKSFWQDRGWASGFREFSRETPDSDWLFEIDAGPILDGFGTAANAFGLAAARRHGRFDQAYALSAEMLAVSWPLPDGTLLGPRVLSHAADAPYLGESGILYVLTVNPSDGQAIVTGGKTPWLVWVFLALCFGQTAVAAALAVFGARRVWRDTQLSPRPDVTDARLTPSS